MDTVCIFGIFHTEVEEGRKMLLQEREFKMRGNVELDDATMR